MTLSVRRISTPTPYAVGPVNAYLIEARPLTLIDSGINSDEARAAFERELKGLGHDVEAIERVLVTHAHPDHYGLVQHIQERSNAQVFFPAREIARVRDRQMLFEIGRLCLEAGMPLDLLFKMDQQRREGPRARLDHDSVVAVAGGETFELSAGTDTWVLETHHMPGHTGGHVVYFEPRNKILFAGDELLPDVSPNPLLEPSLDEPGERRRSLEEYLASLARMDEMDPSIAFPGHGDPITSPSALIRSTIEHHSKRTAEVAARLGPTGRTPFEIASEMYPGASGYDIFLAVSEVVAHLDLVVSAGDAAIETREGVTYYRAAAG